MIDDPARLPAIEHLVEVLAKWTARINQHREKASARTAGTFNRKTLAKDTKRERVDLEELRTAISTVRERRYLLTADYLDRLNDCLTSSKSSQVIDAELMESHERVENIAGMIAGSIREEQAEQEREQADAEERDRLQQHAIEFASMGESPTACIALKHDLRNPALRKEFEILLGVVEAKRQAAARAPTAAATTIVVKPDEPGRWITITQAAADGFDKGTICRAADDGHIADNGKKNRARRIDLISFSLWKQRYQQKKETGEYKREFERNAEETHATRRRS